jgi:hypothetical protein
LGDRKRHWTIYCILILTQAKENETGWFAPGFEEQSAER